VEVRFEYISVTAEVLVGQKGQDTVLNYYSKCIAVSFQQGVKAPFLTPDTPAESHM